MKTLKIIIALGILVVIGVGVYIYSGAYNIGADVPHTRAVYWLANTLREHSVTAHAEDIKVPPLNDPKMLMEGAGQYAAMCSGCHLAPGYDIGETREGLYPKPPLLYKGDLMTPAKTFWVIKHGIKMSGMPAWGKSHDDKELWAITAFVMQLPKLSAQQYKDIIAKAPPDEDMTQMPQRANSSEHDRDSAMLHDIAIINIAVSVLLAIWSIIDLQRRPPPMTVMKWVWPFTFLWGGLFALAMYLKFGRAPPPGQQHGGHQHGQRPMWQSVALGATHCGAGCSLADVIVEVGMFVLGIGFVVLGHQVFGNWIVDYAMALLIGVAFQYGAQAPMSDEPGSTVLWQSFKSDVLSLSFWQIGMYGWMAISIFVLFDEQTMKPDHWSFWLMMQVAMLSGFVTTYPINGWLIRSGVKEAM